jgi:hypothetical protein
MTCPHSGKIGSAHCRWMFGAVALSAIILVQTATADNRFAQPSMLPSQPDNSWQSPTPKNHAPTSWPANESYAQGGAQRTTSWLDSAPGTQAPLRWPGHYPMTEAPAFPTNTRQFHALGDQAQPTSPVNYAYLQDTPAATSTADTSAMRSRGRSGSKLELGGPFISTRTFTFWNDDLYIEGEAQVPVLGRMNVGEHNSPLPRDRAYVIYKNYSNVLNNSVSDFSGNTLGQSSRGISQYLIGFEKTFHEERSSLELRMPFFSTGSSQLNGVFSSNDPSIGNFGLIGKRLLYCDDWGAVAAGCAVALPTGDDAVFSVASQTFTIKNDNVHFVPFLGAYKQSLDEQWFVMAYGALDLPARGNQIQFTDPVAGTQDLGRLVDQTLLYLDFMVGHWFYRNPDAKALTGFAVQTELHYAGTLNDAKSVQGVASGVSWDTGYNFGNTQNRFDNTFAALVLHAELKNQTDIRVAGVFPLNDSNNRFFDSELIVVVVQRF